jgi:glycosyltransferase involved in cell wall biosynthesis
MYDGDIATFKALSQIPGTRLFISYPHSGRNVPLDLSMLSWIEDRYCFTACDSDIGLAHYLDSGDIDEAVLDRKVREFNPDVFFVCSWHVRVYRRLLRRYPHIPKVLRFDNQWLGTWRQRLGVLIAPYYLHRLFDAAFVPGERQAVFARHLGFKEPQIWQGTFTCDNDRFSRVYHERKSRSAKLPQRFLFVGLLLPKKGVQPLIEAYRLYRARATDPWPVTVCGLGPLFDQFQAQEGVDMRGFVQPTELPAIFGQSACLVAPSVFEPWSYVVHEATAAGLSVICTSAAGASVHLVRERFNGFVVAPNDVEGLASAMLQYSAFSDERRRVMGDNSYQLSLQFTPELWAELFHFTASRLIERRNPVQAVPDLEKSLAA